MKIKFLLLTSLVIASMILATGCAPAPAATQPSAPTEAPASTDAPAGETRTLTVWGFVWTADWLDAIAPGFEAEHPGVKVQVERFEYDPYQEMVLTTLASGQGVPDVVTLDPMWAGDLIRGGTVLPLDKATTELNVDDFVPAGWNLYAWQGVQYGIPLDLDFQLVFYRKDVYDAAMAKLGITEFPTTFEDYRALAAEV
jgi:ABC-type glycerol-3-phosphate transport system substrate-binding protein